METKREKSLSYTGFFRSLKSTKIQCTVIFSYDFNQLANLKFQFFSKFSNEN